MIRSRFDRARASARNWTRWAAGSGRRAVRKLPASIRVPLVRLAIQVRSSGSRRSIAMTPMPGPRVDVPEVTVVVTSRNRAELLAVGLRSVQEQDLTAFECIVIDDDSTDDAVSVAQAFAAVDPRFHILVHDHSRGPSAARNAGLAAARAPFVCFLDDDDFLLAGSLRARREAFDGQPADVIGAFCDWINTEPEVGLEAFRPRRTPRRRRGFAGVAGLRRSVHPQ